MRDVLEGAKGGSGVVNVMGMVRAGMNSGVMLFRRGPWMRDFLEQVAALGRIPEPELGKVWGADPHSYECFHRILHVCSCGGCKKGNQ